jgi:uncharacterized protein YkwD
MRRTLQPPRSAGVGLLALLLAVGAVGGSWDALPWVDPEPVRVSATTTGDDDGGEGRPESAPADQAAPELPGRTWPDIDPTTTTTAAPPAPAAPADPAPTTTRPRRTAAAPTSAPVPAEEPAPAPAPTTPPPPAPTTVGSGTQQSMLAQVNAVRAAGRSCGGTWYPPVHGLSLSGALNTVATAHAVDMAVHGYFDHTGLDGSDAGTRMERAGYRWSAWGENIAAGQSTAGAAVQGWFDSPGHCVNFMSGDFTNVGFGLADLPGSPYGTYWVAALGRPA